MHEVLYEMARQRAAELVGETRRPHPVHHLPPRPLLARFRRASR